MEFNVPVYDDELRRSSLSENDEEYNSLRFKFELWTGTSQLKNFSVYEIENSVVRNNFEQNCGTSDIIEAWTNCANNEECNHPLRVKRQGFTVHPPGFPICSGKISLMRERQIHKTRYQFIVSMLATRKVLCRDKTPERKKEKTIPKTDVVGSLNTESPIKNEETYPFIVPKNYDTLYVDNPNSNVISINDRIKALRENRNLSENDNLMKGKQDRTVRNNRQQQWQKERSYPTVGVTHYIVKNSNQLLPKYLVEFNYNPEEDKKLYERLERRKICESCGKAKATFYCFQDGVRLCDDCDRSLHSHSRLLQNHRRIRFKDINNDISLLSQIRISESKEFSKCPHHPDTDCEYFDPILECPVCVRCKVEENGTHATGGNASHPLIPLSEAYKRATESCEMMGKKGVPLPPGTRYAQQRIEGLQRRLRCIHIRMREIFTNLENSEEILVQKFNKLMRDLLRSQDEKISALYSEEVIIKEELLSLQSSTNFMKEQADLLDPVQFINLFKRFTIMQDSLKNYNMKKDSDPLPAEADIQVNGDLYISSSNNYDFDLQNDNYDFDKGKNNPFGDDYRYDDNQYNYLSDTGYGYFGFDEQPAAKFRASLFRSCLETVQTEENHSQYIYGQAANIGSTGAYGTGQGYSGGMMYGEFQRQQQQQQEQLKMQLKPGGFENKSLMTTEPEINLGFSTYGENTINTVSNKLYNENKKEASGLTPFDMDARSKQNSRDKLRSNSYNPFFEDEEDVGHIEGKYGYGDATTPYIEPTKDIITEAIKRAPAPLRNTEYAQDDDSIESSASINGSLSKSEMRNTKKKEYEDVEYKKSFYLDRMSKTPASKSQTPISGRGTPKPANMSNKEITKTPTSTPRRKVSTPSSRSSKINPEKTKATRGPLEKSEISTTNEFAEESFIKESKLIDLTNNTKEGTAGVKQTPTIKTTAQSNIGSPKNPMSPASIFASTNKTKNDSSIKSFLGDYSRMSVVAEEVRKNLVERKAELKFTPFADSKILSKNTAQLVYFCIVKYFSERVIRPRLLWSLDGYNRNMSSMHAIIDDKGSTVVIVRSGTRIFGGFASESWNSYGEPFGDKGESFLFSIDNDRLLRYKGGICLIGTHESIIFGDGDLILSEDFRSNYSELGNSYGYEGMTNEEKSTLLAGCENFNVDNVEIYCFDE